MKTKIRYGLIHVWLTAQLKRLYLQAFLLTLFLYDAEGKPCQVPISNTWNKAHVMKPFG